MTTTYYCHLEVGVAVTMCLLFFEIYKRGRLHILLAGNVALFKHVVHYGSRSDFQYDNLTTPSLFDRLSLLST